MVSKPSASATNGLPHSQIVANEAQVQIPLPKHLLAASPPQKPWGTWHMKLCNAWDEWLDSDSELPSDHRGPWSEKRRMTWSSSCHLYWPLWVQKSVGAEESHPSAVLALALQMCFGIEHSPKTSKCVMDVSWVYPECTILSLGSCQALYCTKM